MQEKCYREVVSVTAKKTERPQIAISKKRIEEALLQSLAEKPFDQITVTELSNRAGLSRRTFYRHYDSVNAVLGSYLGKVCDDHLIFMTERLAHNPGFKTAIYLNFVFWEKHKSLLSMMLANSLMPQLLDRFWPEARGRFLNLYGSSDKANGYVAHFVLGGAWNMLVKWVEDGAIATPEEMAEIAGQILAHLGEMPAEQSSSKKIVNPASYTGGQGYV